MPLNKSWADAFWQSVYRLRFELSTGGSYVSMFTSAYDRARQLARAALPLERPLAIVAAYPSPCWSALPNGRAKRTKISKFDMLHEMGVSTDAAQAAWKGWYYPGDKSDEEASPCEHRAITLSWDEADILLWNNIAQDISVEPRAPVLSKLVDPQNAVVVNAYDDRGMDIIALSREPIEHLYREFDGWLLDYDRPRMAEVFGPQGNGS